jgi:pimeloyl-ACP methyl ester carboxylesterase
VPVVFFVHLAATLDNWDPRIIDPIAAKHHVFAFDNRGVGASTGTVPNTVEEMADDALAFIDALGLTTIDIFSFSLGGMIAQALVLKRPNLVRRLILTGTGPAGGKGIDKIYRVTFYDIARATLMRSDPKEFLFFNRDATGKAAGKAFVQRLEERTADRDEDISVPAFRAQLKPIKRWVAPPPPTSRESPSRRSSPTATTTAWSPPPSPKTCTAASPAPSSSSRSLRHGQTCTCALRTRLMNLETRSELSHMHRRRYA